MIAKKVAQKLKKPDYQAMEKADTFVDMKVEFYKVMKSTNKEALLALADKYNASEEILGELFANWLSHNSDRY